MNTQSRNGMAINAPGAKATPQNNQATKKLVMKPLKRASCVVLGGGGRRTVWVTGSSFADGNLERVTGRPHSFIHLCPAADCLVVNPCCC